MHRANAYTKLFLFVVLNLSAVGFCDFKFNPEIRAESLDYADPLSPVVNQYLGSLRLTIPATLKIDDHFKFKIAPFAQSDPTNYSPRETFFWDPSEAYVEWKSGYNSVQAGYNVFNWNGTDGYNPVDVVNPRIFFDPLRSDKRGSPSIAYRGGSDLIDWQLIYIPTQVKTELPGENSRWLPRAIYVPDTATNEFILPSEIFYSYAPDADLDNSLTNNYGGRIQLHLNSIDSSIQYFEGEALTPAVVPTVTGQIAEVSPILIVNANPNISLQPNYYRHRLVGATSTVTVGETIFRVAAAYDQPLVSGLDVPGWSFNVVVELEHSFSVGRGTLTIVPEYGYGVHQDSAGDDVTSLNRIFDNSTMMGVRYAPNDTWTILISALYNFNTSDQYGSVQVTHEFSDVVKASLSGDYFGGTSTSILGNYLRNNRGIADVTVKF